MRLLPKRKRPLPPKTFEAIEFGAGDARHIASQAKKTPNRLFLAVEPGYRPGGFQLDPVRNYSYTRPCNSPILTSASTMEETITMMKQKGLRSRNIIVRMPDPRFIEGGLFNLEKLFKEARNLLLPNRKIIITTESDDLLKKILMWAKKYKLSVKKPVLMREPIKDKSLKGHRSRLVVPRSTGERCVITSPDKTPWHIEITLGLKQAFPKKWQRRILAQEHE